MLLWEYGLRCSSPSRDGRRQPLPQSADGERHACDSFFHSDFGGFSSLAVGAIPPGALPRGSFVEYSFRSREQIIMTKILIIEDQSQLRRELAMILECEHFEVTTAPNGLIGLNLPRSNPPDVVICDIMMPKLDGYAVLESLRGDPATATIPFIFLTAKGEPQDQRAGMSTRADDYLAKPFLKDDLLNSIRARLKRRDLEEQRLRDKARPGSLQPRIPLSRATRSPRPLAARGRGSWLDPSGQVQCRGRPYSRHQRGDREKAPGACI